MSRQKIFAKGYDWREGEFKEKLILPKDTEIVPDADEDGAVRWVSGVMEIWDGTEWIPQANSSGASAIIVDDNF